MPSKITSSVKGLVKEPIDTIKKGLKTAIKPATSEGTGAVFVGAVLSAPIGYLYAKGYGMIEGKVPFLSENVILSKILRFALPLIPIYFVKRFKVPLGNLINGTLLGIFVMQIVMEIWGLAKGTAVATTNNNETVLANNNYAEF